MIRDEHASARAAVLRALAGVSGASTAALVRATGLSQDRVRAALSGLTTRKRVTSTGRRGQAPGTWRITDAGRTHLAKLGEAPAPAPKPARLPVLSGKMLPGWGDRREDCESYERCLYAYRDGGAAHCMRGCSSYVAAPLRAVDYTIYAGGTP